MGSPGIWQQVTKSSLLRTDLDQRPWPNVLFGVASSVAVPGWDVELEHQLGRLRQTVDAASCPFSPEEEGGYV
jgi:hypothetical protein